MFAYANTNGVARCRDSRSPSEVPYHCHMLGKQYKPPPPRHKKYLTKVPTYWKMVSYPLIKEGQLSHKNVNCAGTPMFYTALVLLFFLGEHFLAYLNACKGILTSSLIHYKSLKLVEKCFLDLRNMFKIRKISEYRSQSKKHKLTEKNFLVPVCKKI